MAGKKKHCEQATEETNIAVMQEVPFELSEELSPETQERVRGHARRKLYGLADRAVDLLEEAANSAHKTKDKLEVSSTILAHIGLGPKEQANPADNMIQIPADTLFQGLVTLGKVFGMQTDGASVQRAAENMRNVTPENQTSLPSGGKAPIRTGTSAPHKPNIELNMAIEAVRSAEKQ
jgi:hypothetical protein